MRGKRNRKAPEETPKRNKPKKPKAKPFFTYTVDQMVDAVKGGRLKINAAAKAFKVPRSTLENKVKGTSPMIRKMGPSSILTAEEEGILVAWIIQCSRAGFPISKLELIDSAQRLIKELKRDNPFTDGRPGRKWYDAFLARHPEISLRVPQNLTSSRATVTKEALIKWHGEIEAYLKEIHSFDILKDKNRVWNADEAAFFLNPKGSKVLVSRGNKSVYSLVNTDEKERNYEGELFPGQVIAKKSNGATVKVMTMAGNGWKWPDKDDILFYNFCDIEAIIEPPTLQNSRGVCSVPEILKCKKKLHF